MDNGSGFLQHMDQANEQSYQATFKLRLAKLAWYRSYILFVRDPGSGARPEDEGFNNFIKTVVPNASRLTKECIQRLTSAGFRYDYFCRQEQNSPNSGYNDGYLFLLPEFISHHQWEKDLLETELQQARRYLHCLGLQQIADAFPRSLHVLARSAIDHYLALIKFPWMNLAARTPITQFVAGPTNATNAAAIPITSLAQTLDSSLLSLQPRPNNTVTGFQQRPEPTREQAVTYGQQPSRTAHSNRRHELTVYKRARSPTPPGSASAHAVDFQQANSSPQLEPRMKMPRVLTDHTRIPSMTGQAQPNGVSHGQQQHSLQDQSVVKVARAQQQLQHGSLAFANSETVSVREPTTFCSGPAGPNASVAFMSKMQDPPGANADPVAVVVEATTQGPKLAPLLPYQDPKNPNQINSVAKSHKPECKRLTELESLRLNQQQQPQRFHQRGTLSYPFVKKEQTSLAETATKPETPPASSKNVTEPKQTRKHTPSAQRDSHTPTSGSNIRSPSTQLVSRPNTSPKAAKDTEEHRRSDSAAYIDQCHGITPEQARESCNAPTPEQQSSPPTSTHTIPHQEKPVKSISPEPVEASIPPEEQ
ncbi:MAG: hypothetical protein Q9172_007507, partial [Xanthocarpia lactea]